MNRGVYTSHRTRRAHGATLIELLVALALAALVLGTATLSMLRQQRTAARVAALWAADLQLASASIVLPGELAQLAYDSGDLVAGEASDTALEIRAPVASSLACRSDISSVSLVPQTADSAMLSGVASSPRIGDSLWWLPDGDSIWRGRRILASTRGVRQCASPIAALGASDALAMDGSDTVFAGVPLRVTRHSRYVVYRASEGRVQLGMREWTEATQRFAPVQPFAGPFVRREGGISPVATGFRYFDAAGTELTNPVDVKRIRRVRVTALMSIVARDAGQDSIRRDSSDIAIGNARDP